MSNDTQIRIQRLQTNLSMCRQALAAKERRGQKHGQGPIRKRIKEIEAKLEEIKETS